MSSGATTALPDVRVSRVRRRPWVRGLPVLVVAALVGCVLVTTVLFVRAQPNSYTSTAVLSLTPRDPVQTGSDDLMLAAARYVAFLAAPATTERVSRSAGFDARTPAGTISVLQQPGTVNIQVSVTGTAPDAAASMANALAAEGARGSAADSQVIVELIVPGVVATAPSGPPRTLLLLGGGGVAAVALVFGIAALTRRRPDPRPT